MRPLYEYQRGEYVSLYINQGYRDSRVLYGDGERALIEYRMPAGTSGLRLYQKGKGERIVSYRGLPAWLLGRLAELQVEWWGNPQGSTPVGTPAELYAERVNSGRG